MNVGERIKYFREQKNITINKLANLAGVSQSYVRSLEMGATQPTVEYLTLLCDALGITLERFFIDEAKHEELYQMIQQLSESEKNALTAFLREILSRNN